MRAPPTMPRLLYLYTQAKPCVRSAAPPPLLRRFPSIALRTDADGRTFNEIGPQPSARNKVLTLKIREEKRVKQALRPVRLFRSFEVCCVIYSFSNARRRAK